MICIDIVLRDENVEVFDNAINFDVNILDKGDEGRTPIKGKDYWTSEDIKEIKRGILLDNNFEEISIKDIDLLF